MTKIDKNMTIGQILQIDRGIAPIFMQYGMHCLGCPSATGESLEQAAMVHGINVDELIEALNSFFAEK